MSGPSASAIFRWDTLREVTRDDLVFETGIVPGMRCEVELTNGATIPVWRGNDRKSYFCHGLTFGGKSAPGGAVSPYTGLAVVTILHAFYEPIPEAEAKAADILVWRGIDLHDTPHSAVLIDPVLVPGKTYLAGTALLRSKNGIKPEADVTLDSLNDKYRESYNAYRRQ